MAPACAAAAPARTMIDAARRGTFDAAQTPGAGVIVPFEGAPASKT